MMPNKVKFLMSKQLIKVQKGTPVKEAVKIMADNNVGSILIFDNDKLLGIFTERDLLRVVASGIDLDKPIEFVATVCDLITVDEDTPVGEAAKIMAQHNIRHLIVTDKSGKVVGILSIRDIISEKHILTILSNSEKVEEWTGGD